MWFSFRTRDVFSLLFLLSSFPVWVVPTTSLRMAAQGLMGETDYRLTLARLDMQCHCIYSLISLNHFVFVLSEPKYLKGKRKKKKSIDQSLYRLILFFAVLWCCPGQLHMTVTGRFSAGTVPVWDPMPSSSPMQIVQLCSCSIIMIR